MSVRIRLRRPAWITRRAAVRLGLPFLAVGLLFTVTWVTHGAVRPAVTADAFLNPASSAPTGGTRLAARLRATGVPVDRYTGSAGALRAAYRGDTTMFVPAPMMMHPYYLRMFKFLPSTSRVVLVAPDARTLQDGHVRALAGSRRWATGVTTPDCTDPDLSGLGEAAVLGIRYGPLFKNQPMVRCYRDAVARLRVGVVEVLLVGAEDPFRNDRINERHNADLAMALLGGRSKVAWLDLHRPEPPPEVISGPDPAGIGTLHEPEPGEPGDPDFPLPGEESKGGGGSAGGDDRVPDPDNSNPLWTAFPHWVWWVVTLLALIWLVLALAAARRLGPPVSEPLPVTVRTGETVEGRGRLYRRSRGRLFALEMLRAATVRRIGEALHLPPDTAPDTVVQRVAERTGRSTVDVQRILYGDTTPTSDAALVRGSNEMLVLFRQVRHLAANPAPGGDER